MRPKPDPAADAAFMDEALRLARLGVGRTRPNPPVGAVVVDRRGRIVGRGSHPGAGMPHAEILALRQAGARARGATLYVTLEPCCTWGRTPPCTEAIGDAGIRRVAAAVADPNPRHRGRGFRRLRARGLDVSVGVGKVEAVRILEPFARWVTTGRPWVTLKLAVSLDGRIADAWGASRWITGPAARRRVQELRRSADAILIGAGTLRADDPSLLPRPARGRRPWRVIVAGSGPLPPSPRVLTDGAAGRTLLVTTADAPEAPARAWLKRGAQWLVLPAAGDGRPDLRALFDHLGKLGCLHVVCEGGGQLAASLLRDRRADELWWLAAPLILGGPARPAVGGPGWPLATAPRLSVRETIPVGRDWLIRARPSDRHQA